MGTKLLEQYYFTRSVEFRIAVELRQVTALMSPSLGSSGLVLACGGAF